ncbi:MAG: chemotaxis protein CheW, partial [Alteromonas macleodii]|nr:chemotaxis protein CheW [Alteromonas macleodii]
MSKQSPFAREEVMEAYLDSLLKEPEAPEDVTARTAKLLEQASQQMAETALASTANESEPQSNEQEAIAEKVTSLIETQKAETIEDEQQQSHAETLVENEQEAALNRAEKT